MKERVFETKAMVYTGQELPERLQALVETAKAMTKHSYSPYSQFRVGAAVALANGEVIGGSNQENAAYPSGLCAERTAIFYANAKYPDQPVEAIAIACYTDGAFTRLPGTPCGACRQVLLETEHRFGKDIKIVLYGEEEVIVFDSAKSLLPLYFVSDNLKG